jgi:hypothetical protein
LNGDEESNNVITQEQIAHCKANRLNALAIREPPEASVQSL